MAKILKPVSKISGIYGQPGEEKVSAHLAENLPDEYLVLNSPRIFYRGQVVDIDHVVIGPNGLFVVESKNMQGRVRGGLMGNWVQEKRRGSGEQVAIGNPANQISQYAKILRSFISDNYAIEFDEKLLPRVFPVVAFVHEQADLSGIHYTKPGMVGKVKVLNLHQLVEYIQSPEVSDYDEELRERIAHIIVPPEQRDQTGFFNPVILKEGKDQFLTRYEIIEEIGQGSFGAVYRGYDFKLEREVAVKKLHGRLKDNPEAVKLFFREAQVAAKLTHENIVAVFDYYEEKGDYYLILEYVEGLSLDQYLGENEISMMEAAEIFEDICAAVEEAHRHGVIHLDLKPGNIIITPERRVKVTDFGMAQMIEGQLFENEAFRGTPSIMAPEQVEGGAVDERTDVFALGILAYLLVTGVHPFPGANVGETVHKIVHFEPISPRTLVQQLPDEAADVMLKALHKNPDERYQNVSGLLAAWGEAMSPENLMYFTPGKGSFLPGKIFRVIGRLIPRPIRRVMSNDKKRFAFLTFMTVVIFAGFFVLQVLDSRAVNNVAGGNQFYGFTNNNLKALYENPNGYKGVPVQLIGSVDKILKMGTGEILFSLSLEPTEGMPYSKIVVSYRDPHFLVDYSQFFKVSGAVAERPVSMTSSEKPIPLIIADKVEPIEDPWTVLAPSLYNVYARQMQNHSGKEVTLEKVEFSATETRLFLYIKNNTDRTVRYNLAEPHGIQGGRNYKLLKDHYGNAYVNELSLAPRTSVREVIFLEKMDLDRKEATFILGKSSEEEQPYIYRTRW